MGYSTKRCLIHWQLGLLLLFILLLHASSQSYLPDPGDWPGTHAHANGNNGGHIAHVSLMVTARGESTIEQTELKAMWSIKLALKETSMWVASSWHNERIAGRSG